jgi:hypothetical protein
MLRFIFVCMGVVALSLIAIAGQFVMDGASDATDTVIARNAVVVEQEQEIAMDDASIAEQLNAIETTAGSVTFDPNDTFSGGFTNEAPKALQDAQPSMDEQTN